MYLRFFPGFVSRSSGGRFRGNSGRCGSRKVRRTDSPQEEVKIFSSNHSDKFQCLNNSEYLQFSMRRK